MPGAGVPAELVQLVEIPRRTDAVPARFGLVLELVELVRVLYPAPVRGDQGLEGAFHRLLQVFALVDRVLLSIGGLPLPLGLFEKVVAVARCRSEQ